MWKILSSVLLGWSLGANDSANIFGTGVATGTIKYRTAIFLTAIFVLLGALLEGPKCMKIVGELSTLLTIEAFYCSLAAAITMAVLTFLAIPASASQAIIGAVIGAGILSGAADFSKLYKIIICWIITPVSGIVFGYFFHRSLRYVLDKTITNITHLNYIYSTGILVAGCYGAYSLGSNNVANVTGVYVGSGLLSAGMASLIGGISIALGSLTYGKKVMMTVGKGIASLDPFSAFVTILAEAFTLHIFTQIGVPVSSSQAIVGAVVGVGIVGGLRTVSAKVVTKITIGWFMTPLAAGILTVLFIKLFAV
ncbi:MAG: inorganic phosphate transporter family protein [Deltaproteobacteria bacterium]|nr:inorganic phosphate transporter family protein [Deltaproteobacteria bacterium]